MTKLSEMRRSSEPIASIPLRKLRVGSFETRIVEPLVVHLDFLEIEFQGVFSNRRIILKKTDVTRIEQSDRCINIRLRPSKASELAEKVPVGVYIFHSKGKHSEFKLYFSEPQNENLMDFLSQFCVSSADTSLVEENCETEKSPQRAEKSKGEELPAGSEDGPPEKKKAKSEYFPERQLRSRARRQIEKFDYRSEDDQSPPRQKKSKISKKKLSSSRFDRFEDMQELIQYPSTAGGEIIVRMEDYKCLAPEELLSDVLIDFYLQHIYNGFSDDLKKRVHIFNSYFYRLLGMDSNYAGWKDDQNKGLTAQEKRYQRVRDYSYQGVNIFEKDFLVFPCIENSHWFLVIICYPSMNGATDSATGQELPYDEMTKDCKTSAGSPALVSCILAFDSAKSGSRRTSVAINHLRNFLLWEHKTKYEGQFAFDPLKLRGMAPKCPQQPNATDCGLFVMQFFEHFFVESPILDFRFCMDKSEWFDPDIIMEKRKYVASLIQNLMVTDQVIELPDIFAENSQEETNSNDFNNNKSQCEDGGNKENLSDNVAEPKPSTSRWLDFEDREENQRSDGNQDEVQKSEENHLVVDPLASVDELKDSDLNLKKENPETFDLKAVKLENSIVSPTEARAEDDEVVIVIESD